MIKWFVKVLIFFLAFLVLTILTQIGGVILFFSMLISTSFTRNVSSRLAKTFIHLVFFLAIYVTTALHVVPHAAKVFGRVALPIQETNGVKPLNYITCLTNRHYVTPGLYDATLRTARKLNAEFPGTSVNYLDACFPFYDGFPLWPHLSHNDGKKIDIAFFYRKKGDGSISNEHPSLIGYGVSEEPRPREINRPRDCEKTGNWQYSFLKRIVPQARKANFDFDHARNKRLVEVFSSDRHTTKILIEPHLKKRLRLSSAKIGLHGCNSVRHDDHIHVQVR